MKGLQQRLVGILGYQRMNVLGISGLNDGKAVTFTGGTSGKSAIKSMTFGGVPPLKSKTHATWNVQIVQPKANNPTVVVRNLKVLIAQSGGARNCVDGLAIRKGQPIPFDGKLKRLEILAHDQITDVVAAEVEAGGSERTIVIPHILEREESRGRSSGFSGRSMPAGSSSRSTPSRLITPSKRKIE